MIDYKTIGERIRKRRLACNLSQEKLAEICDELENAGRAYEHQLSELLADCDSQELMIITDTVQALKTSLRK